MARNFIGAGDELMLLPVDMREWLPGDDIVWLVRDVVDRVDLSAFYGRYRDNGQGAAAYEPSVMVTVVLYAHAMGVKSSRAIERACRRDVGFKVAAGQLVPDHSTLTRFIARHREELEALFGQVLALCHEAKMTRFGVIAIDGTKVAANASWAKSYQADALEHQLRERQQEFDQLAAQLLGEHLATDAAEEAAGTETSTHDGDGDGWSLPAGLADQQDRIAAIEAARHRLAVKDRAALRHRQDRLERTKAAAQQLADQQQAAREQMLAEQKAKQAVWDARHAAGETRIGNRPKDEVQINAGRDAKNPPRASIIDPDSRRMKAKHGFVQGYNVQVAVTDTQVICGVLVSQTATDHHLLPPVLAATRKTLAAAGIDTNLRTLLADAGYANEDTFKAIEDQRLVLLSPVASDQKRALGADPGGGRDLTDYPATARAQQRLRTEAGKNAYALRGRTVEPVIGQLKERIGLRQFSRRGLKAVTTEAVLAATVHNLRKLHTWTQKNSVHIAPISAQTA